MIFAHPPALFVGFGGILGWGCARIGVGLRLCNWLLRFLSLADKMAFKRVAFFVNV